MEAGGNWLISGDDLSEMMKKESEQGLVDRMVFIECRPKEGTKGKIFPAFVQEEGPKPEQKGRHWIFAIVQRLKGSIEMVKVWIQEEDIGVRYRIWNDVPYLEEFDKPEEWPEVEDIQKLKERVDELKERRDKRMEELNKTATDGEGKEDISDGAALQPGASGSSEGVSGKELDAESHADE